MAKSMTASMSKGTGAPSPLHDLRNEEYVRQQQAQGKMMNIDPEYTKYNKDLMTEFNNQNDASNYQKFNNIETEFNNLFAPWVEKYNQKCEKKGHPKRKIKNFYKHILKQAKTQKNPMLPAYEYVFQFGSREDGNWKERAEMIKKMFFKMLKTPEFSNYIHTNYAVLHVDERNGSPHIHWCFTPIAYGYKRGLEVKPALNKALQQLLKLNSRVNSYKPFIDFVKTECMEKTLNDFGYELKESKEDRAHSTVKEFKEIKKAEAALADLKVKESSYLDISKKLEIETQKELEKKATLLLQMENSKQNYKKQMSIILKNYQKQKQDLTKKLMDLNSRSSNELTPSQQQQIDTLQIELKQLKQTFPQHMSTNDYENEIQELALEFQSWKSEHKSLIQLFGLGENSTFDQVLSTLTQEGYLQP